LGHPGVEEPISDKTVWNACREAAVRAGLSKTIGPHTLRHYVARRTMSRDEGCDSGSIWNRREKRR
jgi:site-specific recombinase XerD